MAFAIDPADRLGGRPAVGLPRLRPPDPGGFSTRESIIMALVVLHQPVAPVLLVRRLPRLADR